MSIKLKIEKQFLYWMKKALRMKKMIKYSKLSLKSLAIFTCLVFLTWKLNQKNSFILLPSWYKLTIMDWKFIKKSMLTIKTIQKAWMKTITYVPNSGKISTWMSRNKVINIPSHNLKQ